MGTSSRIFGAEIGTRSGATPGDIDSTTAMPDVSGVTFVGFYCEGIVESSGGGTSRVSSADYGNNRPGRSTPRHTGFINRSGGALFDAADNEAIDALMVDTVTMTARFMGFGDTTITGTPEYKMLSSVMAYDAPTTTSIAATGAGSDFGNIPVADTSAYDIEIGDFLVRGYTGGRVTYHKVVDITAGAPGSYDVHPFMDSATGAETLGVAGQWYAVTGNANTTAGDFHVRVSAGGNDTDAEHGRLLPMCRLGGLSLGLEGDALIGEWTVSSTVALVTDSSADVNSVSERDGRVLNAGHNSTVMIGPDVRGQSAPYNAAPTYSAADRYSYDAAFEWEISNGPTDGLSVCGTVNRDVADANMTMNLAVLASASNEGQTLKRMLANEEQRHVCVVFGPGYTPGTDTPTGGAVWAVVARTEDESAVTGNDEGALQRDVTLAAVNDAPNICNASTPKAIAPFAILHPLE